MTTNHTPSSPSDPRGETAPATPAELRDIERRLDAMGSRERASAPRGLEDRLFAASLQALRTGEAPAGAARDRQAGTRGWFMNPGLRLAAAVAIVALVGAAAWRWNAGTPTVVPSAPIASGTTPSPALSDDDATLQADFESFFASADEVIEPSGDLAEAAPSSDSFWDSDSLTQLEDSM